MRVSHCLVIQIVEYSFCCKKCMIKMGIKGGAQIKNGQLFFKHKPQNNSKNITVLLRKSTKMSSECWRGFVEFHLINLQANEKESLTWFLLRVGIILVHSASVMASTEFIHRKVSIKLEITLFALFYDIASSASLYQSIGKALLRHKMLEIFDDLSKIYDESKTKIAISCFFFF